MATEETRNKIAKTALQMFSLRGCRAVTMDDIAQTLHISKRTLYETYANKEELLAECLKMVHDSINSRHIKAHSRVDEPLLVAMYMLRANANSNQKYHLLLEEAERYYPEIHDRYFKIHSEAMRKMMQQGFAYAKQHHYLREDADIDVAVDFMCDLLQQHRMTAYAEPQRHVRLINEVCFTYLRGMMNVEAIERYEKAEDNFRQVLASLDQDEE